MLKIKQLIAWVGTAWGLLVIPDAQAGSATPAITAALQVAAASPKCKAIEPFYWEIGDARTPLVSGQEGARAPGAHTVMPIASASKWVFGAYVVQVRTGQLSRAEIDALTMRTGYTSFKYSRCVKLLPGRRDRETVNDCLHEGKNAEFSPQFVGKFFYNGGHFQQFSVTGLGLGEQNNATLAQTIRRGLGIPFAFEFGSPQLAAGIQTSAADYGGFLRALLDGRLLLGAQLGSHAVCTNPASCPQAQHTPVPGDRQWQYSLGHWVETGPASDGAFSSAGAFGFYPWIDAHKQYYGIVAREKRSRTAAVASAECGQEIRRAFLQAL